MKINLALKYIRKFSGISQMELSNKLGFNPEWASKIERDGHIVELKTIEKYSLVFDLPVSKIFKFAEVIDTREDLFGKVVLFSNILQDK